MDVNFIFPCDFFNKKEVDSNYKDEFAQACRLNFNCILFDYDEFVDTHALKLYPCMPKEGLSIYRGWMLQSERYQILYELLRDKGIMLINTPEQYQYCHEFPNSYPLLRGITPEMIAFPDSSAINWSVVKQTFPRFMVKDSVKSVKGYDFPLYFDNSYSAEQLVGYIHRFIELRGALYMGGIVLKQYVDLAKIEGRTNEYRAFYLEGRLLSISQNSNQDSLHHPIPHSFVDRVPKLKSRFYTVDFAELENGEWIVMETGDGQVSDLSPNQSILKFYEEIKMAVIQ